MDNVKDFIDEYRATWEKAVASDDVSPLTRFFHIPYVAVGADGSVALHSSEADVRRFNQSRLELFARDQATRWRFRGCDAMTLGSQSTFVTVNWEGQRADGTTARA